MIAETKKILEMSEIEIVPTTIRVPVLRAHSESIFLNFESSPDVSEARAALEKANGIRVIDDRQSNRFPMPLDATGQNDIYVGRLRRGSPAGKDLAFFACGDQIRKGAALNAFQIAELL